jgi:hypothetical protein
MEMITKNKGTLIAIVVFILVIFLYNVFIKSDTLEIPSETSAASVGDDLIQLHERLRKVTLDKSIFTSAGYLQLIDFTTDIATQPVGRTNPFDIIGRD